LVVGFFMYTVMGWVGPGEEWSGMVCVCGKGVLGVCRLRWGTKEPLVPLVPPGWAFETLTLLVFVKYILVPSKVRTRRARAHFLSLSLSLSLSLALSLSRSRSLSLSLSHFSLSLALSFSVFESIKPYELSSIKSMKPFEQGRSMLHLAR
jgi:hypothetical protein